MYDTSSEQAPSSLICLHPATVPPQILSIVPSLTLGDPVPVPWDRLLVQSRSGGHLLAKTIQHSYLEKGQSVRAAQAGLFPAAEGLVLPGTLSEECDELTGCWAGHCHEHIRH